MDELYCEGVRHFLTNYESIREGKLDPNEFGCCSLDEASVLRSYGSKTYQEFLPLFSKVPFKLVATATPSPNRYKELIHYAGFLGVMDTGLALTRWFQRNSEKAGDLTLYPHKEDEFWMWVHSWAAFLQRPSELGYSDDGYELPPLKLTLARSPGRSFESRTGARRAGRHVPQCRNSLQESAKARATAWARASPRWSEIIAQDPDRASDHLARPRGGARSDRASAAGCGRSWDRWTSTPAKNGCTISRKAEPSISRPSRSCPAPDRTSSITATRRSMSACRATATNSTISSKASIGLQRFGQQHPVEVDIIYAEDMRAGRAAVEEKWARDEEMRAHVGDHQAARPQHAAAARRAAALDRRQADRGQGAKTSSRSITTRSPNAAPGRKTPST
jgi:hypothetical protein